MDRTPRTASGGRTRSAESKSLAVLLAGASVLLTVAVLWPMSPQAPVELGAVGALVAAALATATWTLGNRLPRGALLGQAVFAAVANSVLVAEAHTRAGAMADAFGYPWLALYVAAFFPRAAGWYCGLIVAGFGGGLLLADLPSMTAPWAVVSASVAALAALAARVTGALRHQAETDPLTGAANRMGLSRAAAAAAPRGSRADDRATVATLDLDDFKAVNDRHGHSGGDRLLVDAVEAWRSVLRRDDVLARVGGDEFVLLMPRTARPEAEMILRRLRGAHPVPWSAGVAEWRAGETLEDCVRRADHRLYAAKGRREQLSPAASRP